MNRREKVGRCPKPAIHPGEKSSCWEVEWCWNSYQVVVSGHQSRDSVFYITLPLAIRIRFFKTFSLGSCIWRRSFFSQVLAVVQRRNIATLTPGPSSWRSPVCSSSSCLASAIWLFTAGSWAACLHSLPLLWITLGFTSRINDCFLLCSLGKPARLKISRKTPHSPAQPLQIWGDYKKRELKKEIIGSSFPWC